MISDAHLGVTATIKRMFQGSSWRRIAGFAALLSLCRVYFLRNLLSYVPIGEAFFEVVAGQDMVA